MLPKTNASAGASLPLSLSQREVWRDRAAWPDSPHLMIGGGGFLDGPLDVQRCVAALQLLVQECDALRLAPLPDGTQRLLARWEPTLELVEVPTGVEPCAAMQDWWQAARETELIPYSQFLAKVEEGTVTDITVSNQYIRGAFKEPQGSKTQFVTARVDPAVARELQGHGVDF